MVIGDMNLERQGPWPGQIGPNIAPTPADCPPLAQLADDGALDQYIIASKPYGAGLNSIHRPISMLNQAGTPLAFFELSIDLYFPAPAWKLYKSHEMDCKLWWPGSTGGASIVNTANNSLQWLRSGMFQISGSNPWTDTGFNPGQPPSEGWTTVVFRYQIDWIGAMFGPISLSALGQIFTSFPAVFVKMPLQKSNWTMGGTDPKFAGGVSTQLQATLNTVGGAYMVRHRNIHNRWSDNAQFA
jgi:hypothetical protein